MNQERDKEISELYFKGDIQVTKIGKRFGISRQRVHQIATGYRSLSKDSHGQNIRVLILERDKVCRGCGRKRNLQVHHIDKNPNNNETSNLILLCQKCHKDKHFLELSTA